MRRPTDRGWTRPPASTMHGFSRSRRSNAGAKTMSAAKRTAESRPVAAAADDGLLEKEWTGPHLPAGPAARIRGVARPASTACSRIASAFSPRSSSRSSSSSTNQRRRRRVRSSRRSSSPSLPAWIVAAKLYGLYDRDEERATIRPPTSRERVPPDHRRRLALLRDVVARRLRAPGPDEARRPSGCSRSRRHRNADRRTRARPPPPSVPPANG